VRHRPRHLNAFQLGCDGGGLEQADPDGQIQFILVVPQDDDGAITDDTRIRASLPAIKAALAAGACADVYLLIESFLPGSYLRS
jgi:hypothetical protein